MDMKKILFFISLGFTMLMTGCDDPNEGEMFVKPSNLENEMSIIDVLERDGDYSMWIDFLKYANYYNALKDASSEATIFCPNNAAITAFIAERGVASVRDLPRDYARSVAQAHIIANTSITETTLNTYAENATYIPTQNQIGRAHV